eukprot:gb/GFBE01007295.1/.p1 GENE.gb/GFBE01007295.1/~~gb/GFBE01007295.1/.p1  ORF type:complete len:362 (+),score=77.80 gb/GFBE01007295.1/:1-1086(+)
MAGLRRLTAASVAWLCCSAALAEDGCTEPVVEEHLWHSNDAKMSLLQVDTAARRAAAKKATGVDRALPGGDDVVHVAYAGDSMVFEGMITSMLSLSRTISDPENLHIHVIVDEASEAQFPRLVECFRQELARGQVKLPTVELHHAIPLRPEVLEWLTTDRVGERPYLAKPTAFIKFYLDRYFPELPRILLIDTDTIALADVRPLFQMDLQGAPLAAAPDFPPLPIGLRRNMGIAVHPCYDQLGDKQAASMEFNAGVVLFDLTKFNESVTHDVEYFLQNCRDDYDQLALNMKFLGEYKILDQRWNLMLGYPHPPEERADAAILHFTGTFSFSGDKPWLPNSNYSAADLDAYRSNVPSEACYL